MAATTDDKSTENTKSTSTPRQRKSSPSEEAPREELVGVLRTSRIGPIDWKGATSGSTPDEVAERRYAVLEEARKPGDEGYNAHTDPLVPTSTLATVIMTELAAEDSTESPTWNALREQVDLEHEEREALKKFREERLKKAS